MLILKPASSDLIFFSMWVNEYFVITLEFQVQYLQFLHQIVGISNLVSAEALVHCFV